MRINAIPADLMPRAVAFDAAAYALRSKLLDALNGSSAASPVEVETLYQLGSSVDQVQAGLMSLHRSGEAQCCMITGRKEDRSVWWMAGNVARNADWYGIREKRWVPR